MSRTSGSRGDAQYHPLSPPWRGEGQGQGQARCVSGRNRRRSQRLPLTCSLEVGAARRAGILSPQAGRGVVRIGLRLRLGLCHRNEWMAIRPIPRGDLVAPPELARDAPGLDGLGVQPAVVIVGEALRHELRAAVLDRRDGLLRHVARVDVPLVGQPRLDGHARAVTVRDGVCVRLDLLQETTGLQIDENTLARSVTAQAAIGLRHVVVQSRLRVENIDLLKLVPLADLEVVEVVGGRDLDGAGALFGIGVVVADNRDRAADQRQRQPLTDEMLGTSISRRWDAPRRRYRPASSRAASCQRPQTSLGHPCRRTHLREGSGNNTCARRARA